MIAPELRDRNVIVTGGANGSGEAMVRTFHAQGARVFFCDVDARAGHALAKELNERAEFQTLDLTQEREVSRWLAVLGRREGTVHALINNAARDPRIPLGRTSTAEWDELFAINLRAYFLTAREAVKRMN